MCFCKMMTALKFIFVITKKMQRDPGFIMNKYTLRMVYTYKKDNWKKSIGSANIKVVWRKLVFVWFEKYK